jgi:hypothetical protein
MKEPLPKHVPVNDAQRRLLHNEIHTRPSATFKLPALVVYVAVLNAKVFALEEAFSESWYSLHPILPKIERDVLHKDCCH